MEKGRGLVVNHDVDQGCRLEDVRIIRVFIQGLLGSLYSVLTGSEVGETLSFGHDDGRQATGLGETVELFPSSAVEVHRLCPITEGELGVGEIYDAREVIRVSEQGFV